MSRKDIDTPNVLAQISQIDINDINKASAYIKSKVLRTPLVPLNKSVVDKNVSFTDLKTEILFELRATLDVVDVLLHHLMSQCITLIFMKNSIDHNIFSRYILSLKTFKRLDHLRFVAH